MYHLLRCGKVNLYILIQILLSVFCGLQIKQELHGFRVRLRDQLHALPRFCSSGSKFYIQLAQYLCTNWVSMCILECF